MVLSYSDETGKRVTKSFTTHLKEKGNKKQAEAMLMELRRKATAEQQLKKKSGDICFDTYLENWLLKLKPKVSPTTFVAYSHNVRSVCRYFGDRQMPILELSPVDLTGYYDALLQRGLSPTTVRRHHANIHKALKQAVSEGLIAFNPADRVELPPLERYQAQFYSAEECQMLVNAVKDTSIELPVVLTLLLGLRRSEVLGLQWESVDFERHTIHICRSTHQIESELVTRKVLKRKSSYRTLPMPSEVESRLKQESRRQGFICANKDGTRITPNVLSARFQKILRQHGLRRIRYHDLRHTCAALLLAAQVPLIEVSNWLGHSTVAITADLYGHLEFSSKLKCASVLSQALEEDGRIYETEF